MVVLKTQDHYRLSSQGDSSGVNMESDSRKQSSVAHIQSQVTGDTITKQDTDIQNTVSTEVNRTDFKKPWTPKAKPQLQSNQRQKQRLMVSPLVKKLMLRERRRKNSEGGGSSSDEGSQQAKKRWCCSPLKAPAGHQWQQRDDVLDIELSQVSRQYDLHPAQRGSWEIMCGIAGNTSDPVDAVWLKINSIVSEGKLPHCNAVLMESDCVRIFCNFNHCLQVYEILKKEIAMTPPVDYRVQGHGIVLRR